MTVTNSAASLPGYPASVGTLVIEYDFVSGVQGPTHPNPGQPFVCEGFPRRAYLPDDDEGNRILR